MYELNLLPCPFCGGSNVAMQNRDHMDFAMCNDCTAEGPSIDDKRIAAESWNCRCAAPSSPASEELPPLPPFDWQDETAAARVGASQFWKYDSVRQAQREAIAADRRASSAAAVPVDALPPLPVADEYSATRMLPNGELAPRYNASSMRQYALAAVLADRAQRPTIKDSLTFEEDRAQQGEPVNERASFEEWWAGWGDRNVGIVEYSLKREAAMFAWKARGKLAIKAAAPADARVDDLAALVRRLVRALKKANPNSELPEQALDYLQRKGLAGSILRAPAEDAQEPKEKS